jgi:hypothetical protein
MNWIGFVANAHKYLPVVGLVGLAVYHLAAKSDPEEALQDLEQAAGELFGVPVGPQAAPSA